MEQPHRKPKYSYTIVFVCLCILLIGIYGVLEAFLKLSIAMVCLTLTEMIVRVVQYLQNVYKTKDKETVGLNLVNHVFDCNHEVKVIFIAGVMMILLYADRVNTSVVVNMMTFCGIYALTKAIKFDDSKYMRDYWIENSNGLDYGSGIAYNFFYGYLNIILPNKGDENRGLKETMSNYESTEHVEFAVKKLFVLVPRSLHCPPDLAELNKPTGPRFEAAKSMEPVVRNRAGIIQRQYKNTVYKIHRGKGIPPVYVAAEGATPILTLYNTLSHSGPHQESYSTHKHTIAAQFYITIQKLLKDNISCKDICEVVYIDDEDDSINVAEILLQRIEKLKPLSVL